MINTKKKKEINWPSIGYGTYPQKETLINTIPFAIKCGYRLIDVSDNYHNETYVGQSLRSGLDENTLQKLIVVSKFSQPYRSGELEKCFEESNEALNEALNVYLLHWPYPFLWRYQWKKMEELYRQGKCDAIGVCNFDKDMLKKLLKICKIKPFVNQIERHPFFQQNETVEYSKNNGIRIMCYSPVARMDKEMLSNEILCSLSHKYNKTISQIILRWDIQHNDIPIPGSASENHISENINVFDFSLTDNEVKMIDSLECGKRIRFDPRKRFTLKEKLRFLVLRIKLRIEENK